MYEVSNQFKEYCKRHIRTFKNATITYYEGNEQQTIESEEIIKFDISAEPYIDYQIIGQAVAKKIHISIKGSYDLANKEVNVTTTMIYDNNTEEVLNLGNYIIASDYDSSVKNQCSFTGYDYMIKMDDEYSDEGLNYPCTIRDVLENICEQKDIELATTDLPNGNLVVIGNNFQGGATYRDVIKQIAQVNGTFAYIDRENKLHIDQLMNHDTLQGEGTSITLSGTTPYGNILDYMLKGNTTQNGTPTPSSPVPVNNVTGEQVVRVCGKNLLENILTSRTINGLKIAVNTDKMILISGTNSATTTLDLTNIFTLHSGSYIVSTNKRGTISDSCYLIAINTDTNAEIFSLDLRNASEKTLTLSTDTNVKFRIYCSTNRTFTNFRIYPQIEKGTSATSYEEYQGKDYEINLGNIELNKIGDYQDFIRKGTGKNLADISQIQIGKTWSNQTNTQRATILYIPVKKGTNYSLVSKWTNSAITNIRAVFNLGLNDLTSNVVPNSYPYSNTQYDYASIEIIANTTFTSEMLEGVRIMFNEGQVEDYEPYGYKDKWYIEKNVGKIVLNGSERGWGRGSGANTRSVYSLNTFTDRLSSNSTNDFYSDKFSYVGNAQTTDLGYAMSFNGGQFSNYLYIQVPLDVVAYDHVSDFKTWLQSNNTIVYYVLANPTYTLIENEELLIQLEGLNNGYTYADTTNILSSGNLPSSLSMSIDVPYRDAEEEITPSNYLTDFKQSREYGPVNRVQITMTDIEDATYIENAESITKDGIQTITINDNYFLSSEELKAKAIRPLWNSLYTLKYMPISCKYLGLPYIEMNDYIGVVLPNGDVTGTYVFNYKFTYNGGYMGELETPTISRTQETYPTESINSQVQKMGINVDRANARITSEIIARQETDENVTRIEQSIDEINLSVSTTQTDLSNLEGQVQTNTASIGVNADNISLAVEKNTQTQDQLDTLQTNTENVVNQLVFNGDGLTISALGSTSDDMKLNLTNDAINFMYNNNVILKINGSTIEFANASFQKLDLGNYVWVAEDDDSLSLIYEGE